jgi:hypothetical protein
MPSPSQNNHILEIASHLNHLSLAHDVQESILASIVAHTPSNEVSKTLPENFITGSISFDYLVAPLNRNSRIHIYGPPGGGKTSIIGHIIKLLETSHDMRTLWIDTSFKLSPHFLNKTLQLTNTYLLSTGNITTDLINLIRSNKYAVIVIDDIASLALTNEYSELMYVCKVNKILVIGANQIRTNPNNSSNYAAKTRILSDFDITLRIRKYSNGENHNLYNLYLEYYHQRGNMIGESVLIPIDTTGKVLDVNVSKRISLALEAKGFNSLKDMYEAYYPDCKEVYIPNTTIS